MGRRGFFHLADHLALTDGSLSSCMDTCLRAVLLDSDYTLLGNHVKHQRRKFEDREIPTGLNQPLSELRR